MKKILSILTCLLLAFTIVACTSDDGNDSNDTNNVNDDNDVNQVEEEKEENKVPGLGDTITFDELEITFGTDISWDVIDHIMAGDSNGLEVFKVPVTIHNTSDETRGLNMFYFTQYGPSGSTLSSTTYLYFDDTVENLGNILSGGEASADMVFLYEEDGTYTVEFKDFTDEATIQFDITK